MSAYLKEQPTVWKSITDKREEIFTPLAEKLKDKKIKRILLIGTGSSYMASQLAGEFFNNVLKIETTLAIPTRLGALPEFLNPEETLVFAASQTGRSTSTLHAIERLKNTGFKIVAVTAIDNTPIVNACDYYQQIHCGEETVGPKTKGMTSTILTLYLTGMALCKAWGILSADMEEALISALYKSFAGVEENISLCYDFCEKHKSFFAEQPHFTLIGDGFGYPTLQEGALKILETLDVPAFAYEFEEYLHGVNNTIAPGMCNIIVPVNEENFARMKTLDGYCRSKGCLDYIITTADWEDGEQVLKLNGSGEDFTIPFEILPAFQAMSVYGSEHKGINCDLPRNKEFFALLDTKAQDKDSKVWQG